MARCYGGPRGVLHTLQLDYRSMARQTTPCFFTLWGQVARHNVRVLIDSGASHNFICPKLLQLVGLEMQPTSEFVVKVGNGQQVASHGWCKGVEI